MRVLRHRKPSEDHSMNHLRAPDMKSDSNFNYPETVPFESKSDLK